MVATRYKESMAASNAQGLHVPPLDLTNATLRQVHDWAENL